MDEKTQEDRPLMIEEEEKLTTMYEWADTYSPSVVVEGDLE